MGLFVNNTPSFEVEFDIPELETIDEASAGLEGNPKNKYKILIRDKFSAGYAGAVATHWCSIKVTGGDFGSKGVPVFLTDNLSSAQTPNPTEWKSKEFEKLVYASRVLLDNLDMILIVWQGATTDVQNAVAGNLETIMNSKDYYSNNSLSPELRNRILKRDSKKK